MSITATFDKETNILTIEEEGKEKVVLDLGDISKDYVADETISTSPKVRAAASTTKQNTFINFEYTITHGSKEKWQLRRPKENSLVNYYYKNVTRTSSNASNLKSFQSNVESINYYEFVAIRSSLTATELSWLAFILSVPTAGAGTLTAGLAALGAYGSTLNALIKLHTHANYARTYYHRV
ncbi:geobacillin-26 family protein [Metabacillus niabensis]|uniref:SMODS and SLOG-associating 2TM effector domain-containing protein n=1 Tax=Metabacillus niabensis TaxID=324854 RepID=A0ABT9Z4V5_9BACI|nr:geobacillin-26 family protein [Metabacillus niabensis]MDQ0227292.1 hypothetical protein [Metabacillus niabensis]